MQSKNKNLMKSKSQKTLFIIVASVLFIGISAKIILRNILVPNNINLVSESTPLSPPPPPPGCDYEGLQYRDPKKLKLICKCQQRPACLDENPACMLKISSYTVWCSPTPKPSPSIIATVNGVSLFKSSEPCGENKFLNITYTCNQDNLAAITLANGVCTDLVASLNKAISYCEASSTAVGIGTGR